MRNLKLLGAVGACGLIAAGAAGFTSEAPDKPDAGAASVGRGLYKSYCSSCHGKTGLGDGSLAEHLRTPPADLTSLARRNGDVFPFELVAKIIDGRKSVKGHGNADMPAWGDAFEKASGGLSDAEVGRRIDSLTHFVWSIQKAAG